MTAATTLESARTEGGGALPTAMSASLQTGSFYLILTSLAINILSLALPIMTLQVYDRILLNSSHGTLRVLIVGVTFLIVVEAALRIVRAFGTSWAGAAFEHRLTCQAFKHLLDAEPLAVEKQDIGENLERVSAIGKLREFIGGLALVNIIDLPFVALFLGLIYYLSGPLVLMPMAVLAAFSFMAWGGSIELKNALALRNESDEKRANFIIETLNGIHTVKAMGLEANFLRRYERLQSASSAVNHRVAFASAGATVIGTLFGSVMTVSVTAVGALMVISGDLTTGTLVASVLLSGRIMQPIQRALGIWIRYQDYSLARVKTETLFELPAQHRVPLPDDANRSGRLEVQNLSFAYDDGPPVIRDVTISLRAGDSISIGGGHGNGKTTLLKLMAGLYRPLEGTLEIDGVEAWHLTSEDLVSHVGYLPTQGNTFHATIRQNLTGFDDAKEDQAEEIAKLLGIDDIISQLPLGYDTVLGDSTADTIPTGLKQCIAIGRILTNKPRILLFDNADRALDRDAYNCLFKLLGRLKDKVIMVIVSDDRNLLRLAKDEFVLVDGRLEKRDYSDDAKFHDVLPFRELWR